MIFLDSAKIEDAQKAKDMGWIKGITTNPALLAASKLKPEETLKKLMALTKGPLFYQITAHHYEHGLKEAFRAREIIGNQIILKIPATPLGLKLAARMQNEIPFAITSIFSPSQALVASECGAAFAIVYVNRTTRLLGDGLALVSEIFEILKNTETEILAASIKSPEEAEQSIISGAHHLTLPLDIIESLLVHELSQKTFEEFTQKGKGISIDQT
ncbi:MAG: transaldolase [Spirochaetes bacterium]|nr:transaldolase [Spirochaetota bacterium]